MPTSPLRLLHAFAHWACAAAFRLRGESGPALWAQALGESSDGGMAWALSAEPPAPGKGLDPAKSFPGKTLWRSERAPGAMLSASLDLFPHEPSFHWIDTSGRARDPEPGSRGPATGLGAAVAGLGSVAPGRILRLPWPEPFAAGPTETPVTFEAALPEALKAQRPSMEPAWRRFCGESEREWRFEARALAYDDHVGPGARTPLNTAQQNRYRNVDEALFWLCRNGPGEPPFLIELRRLSVIEPAYDEDLLLFQEALNINGRCAFLTNYRRDPILTSPDDPGAADRHARARGNPAELLALALTQALMSAGDPRGQPLPGAPELISLRGFERDLARFDTAAQGPDLTSLPVCPIASTALLAAHSPAWPPASALAQAEALLIQDELSAHPPGDSGVAERPRRPRV